MISLKILTHSQSELGPFPQSCWKQTKVKCSFVADFLHPALELNFLRIQYVQMFTFVKDPSGSGTQIKFLLLKCRSFAPTEREWVRYSRTETVFFDQGIERGERHRLPDWEKPSVFIGCGVAWWNSFWLGSDPSVALGLFCTRCPVATSVFALGNPFPFCKQA